MTQFLIEEALAERLEKLERDEHAEQAAVIDAHQAAVAALEAFD